MKEEETKRGAQSESLHFIEFMEICADSGIISESSARRICQFAKYQGGVSALPTVPDVNENYEERFEYLLGRTCQNCCPYSQNLEKPFTCTVLRSYRSGKNPPSFRHGKSIQATGSHS